MLTIRTRPYLSSEKEIIAEEYVASFSIYRSLFRPKKQDLLSALGVAFFLLVLYAILKNFFEIAPSHESVLLISLLIVAFLFILWRYLKIWDPKFRKYKMDVNADRAEVIHVKTSRAVRRENQLGPGVAFYIDVLAGNEQKTLFLFGQHLEEMELDRKFPNTEFEITRSFKTKQLLNFRVMGSYFRAEKSLPTFTNDESGKGQIVQKIKVLDITIDEVQ